MMLPLNTGFAEVKPVFLLDSIHSVNNGMTDLRLQFPDKPIEYAHLDNGHEAQVLQKPALAGDDIKGLVERVKTSVSPSLPFKMVSSQFAPPCASWSEARQC